MAVIDGNDGPNNIVGNNNEVDTINGLGGNDTINALTRPAGNDPNVNIELVSGGAGTDILVVNAAAETQAVQLGIAGNPRFFVNSDSGNFRINAFSDVELVEFTGGSGNDFINTSSFGRIVRGGAGIDHWLADLSALTTDVAFTLGATTSINAAGLISILGIERINLTTGSGNDRIVGGVQVDVINGGAGNDTINAVRRPAGNDPNVDIDQVSGGLGNDILIVNATAETQAVQLNIAGNPRFFVTSDSGNFRINAFSDVEQVEFSGGSGNDFINTSSFGRIVRGGAGIDHWLADLSALTTNVSFTLGATTAINAAGLISILGLERINLTTGSGNDRITGGAQVDVINGGAGNDTINAMTRPAGNDPNVDIDQVSGGLGNDILIVNAAAETEAVQLNIAGNPRFIVTSDSGNFRVNADSAVERVEFTGGSGNDFINTSSFGRIVRGGAGIDHWLADLSALTTNVTFTLGTTKSILAAGLISILGLERINLTTGSGNDRITGGAQVDVINGGAGNDTIHAVTRPAGNDPNVDIDQVSGGDGTLDTLIINAAAETEAVQLNIAGNPRFIVTSDSGNFRINAFSDVERVMFTGGSGDDFINTSEFGRIVRGGAGIDHWLADLSDLTSNVTFTLGTTKSILAAGLISILGLERINLTTGSGNDRITGGAQVDVISTGDGNDSINVLTRPAGNDPNVNIEQVSGGNGIDTLIVNAAAEIQAVQLNIAGNPRFIVTSNSGRFRVNAASDVEKVKFTSGAGHDQATGGSLADVLTMGAGRDTASGGDGNDTISGGAGNDLLTGGLGADDFTGGLGRDTLDYNAIAESSVVPFRIDEWADFTSGIDKFDFSDIDADSIAANGNSAFNFIGAANFAIGAPGQVRAVAGRVEAEVNGDGAADFRILLTNGELAQLGDFIL